LSWPVEVNKKCNKLQPVGPFDSASLLQAAIHTPHVNYLNVIK